MIRLRHRRGFTLVELMIALTLGLLLIAGLATLVINSSRASRNQQAIGRVQENGRFAMSKIVADLRMAGAQYCSAYANIFPVAGHNRHRPLSVLADGAMPHGLPTRTEVKTAYASTLTDAEPYPLSTRYFLQGHECTTDFNCQPRLNIVGAAMPRPGTAGMSDGSRARAADVLTLRYIAGAGVPIASDYPGGHGRPIPLDPNYSSSAAAPPLNFTAGDLAMITDCSVAKVFEASGSGNTLIPNDTNDGGFIRDDVDSFVTATDDGGSSITGGDSRVFNFTKDFRTVTYFLQLRTDRDDDAGTRRVSSLVRQVNGAQQLITDGVERLEFRYGVEGVDGNVRFLTADQVQAATDCPPFPAGLKVAEPGCMWRSVRMIDVALLMNSVDNDAPTERERFSFTFANQSEIEAPATLPSGLPRGRMFRREFRTTVTLRNTGI